MHNMHTCDAMRCDTCRNNDTFSNQNLNLKKKQYVDRVFKKNEIDSLDIGSKQNRK